MRPPVDQTTPERARRTASGRISPVGRAARAREGDARVGGRPRGEKLRGWSLSMGGLSERRIFPQTPPHACLPSAARKAAEGLRVPLVDPFARPRATGRKGSGRAGRPKEPLALKRGGRRAVLEPPCAPSERPAPHTHQHREHAVRPHGQPHQVLVSCHGQKKQGEAGSTARVSLSLSLSLSLAAFGSLVKREPLVRELRPPRLMLRFSRGSCPGWCRGNDRLARHGCGVGGGGVLEKGEPQRGLKGGQVLFLKQPRNVGRFRTLWKDGCVRVLWREAKKRGAWSGGGVKSGGGGRGGGGGGALGGGPAGCSRLVCGGRAPTTIRACSFVPGRR